MAHARSNAAPTSSRSFVSNMTWCSVCGSSNGARARASGVVALVAVVEADLELDARRDLHLQPVGLRAGRGRRPGSACDSSNAVVANTTWPKPDAVGEEPARHQRRRERAWPPSASPLTSSTGTPHGAVVRASRSTRRSARVVVACPRRASKPAASRRAATSSKASASTASSPTKAASFGRPGCDDDPLRLVVVAPGERPVGGGLAGHEADHLAEERGEGGGVGDLDAEVGELDLVAQDALPYVTVDGWLAVAGSDWNRSAPERLAPAGGRSSCRSRPAERFDHWRRWKRLQPRA